MRLPRAGGAADGAGGDANGSNGADGAGGARGAAPESVGNATEPSEAAPAPAAPRLDGVWRKFGGLFVTTVAIGVGALAGAVACMCLCSRVFRRRAKGMLSRDMFSDREMQSMDWEVKSNAAGWRHDDDL